MCVFICGQKKYDAGLDQEEKPAVWETESHKAAANGLLLLFSHHHHHRS